MTKAGDMDGRRDGGSAPGDPVEPARAVGRNGGTATRVLIVGGGVAGIELATKLGRASRRSATRSATMDVTLVDKNLAHVWKPALHTIAAGTSRLDQQRFSLLVQAKRNGFTFKPGSLVGVDRHAKSVTLAPFTDLLANDEVSPHVALPYDVLILAIGSRANDFSTPGVAWHCSMIDDVGEAEVFHAHLRRHIFLKLETAAPLDIAIVGGGATGVELAAEVKRAVDGIAGYGPPGMRRELRLTLIEAGPRLLAAFPQRISEAAAGTLRDLGIVVRTGATVTEATPEAFVLKDGSRIEAGLKVWAAGIKAPDVIGAIEGLDRSRSGQLLVTRAFQTTRDDAIFALGDCASLSEGDASNPVPATAQAARQEAIHLGRHFPAWLKGTPMPPFRYRDRGSVVSLADYNGWGTLGHYTFGGGRLRGLSARLAHDLLFRQHQLEIMGLPRGLLGWVSDDFSSALQPSVRLD